MSLYSLQSLVHQVSAGSSPADSTVLAVAPIATDAVSATYYSNATQAVQHYLRTMCTSACALHNSTRAVECDGTHVTTALPIFTVDVDQSIAGLTSRNHGIPKMTGPLNPQMKTNSLSHVLLEKQYQFDWLLS